MALINFASNTDHLRMQRRFLNYLLLINNHCHNLLLNPLKLFTSRRNSKDSNPDEYIHTLLYGIFN